jgi:hypothetical protein
MVFVEMLYTEILDINVSIYISCFLFAMRVQQFYTALEDLLKQIAKSFENHIDSLSNFPNRTAYPNEYGNSSNKTCRHLSSKLSVFRQQTFFQLILYKMINKKNLYKLF